MDKTLAEQEKESQELLSAIQIVIDFKGLSGTRKLDIIYRLSKPQKEGEE